MIKAGSKVKVISINKDNQGRLKLYSPNMEDFIGETGVVTKRKNKNGYVEVDLDDYGPHWTFERSDLEVIS